MGLKMAEYEPFPVSEYISKPGPAPAQNDPPFLPYWARCRVQCAQNLLACSNEPIEYDHDDEDYSDNCFFFPEDCSWTPPKDWVVEAHCQSISEISEAHTETDAPARRDTTDTMIPGLPDIKMLDSEALGDLLEDNLSPPEITSILYVSCLSLAYIFRLLLTQRYCQCLRHKRRHLCLRICSPIPSAAQSQRHLRRRIHMLRKERLERKPHRCEPGQPPIILRDSPVHVTGRRGLDRL